MCFKSRMRETIVPAKPVIPIFLKSKLEMKLSIYSIACSPLALARCCRIKVLISLMAFESWSNRGLNKLIRAKIAAKDGISDRRLT